MSRPPAALREMCDTARHPETMPTLIFERTRFTVDCPEGGRIVDVCDEHIMAGIPFSCRHANCGTCRVAITEGLEFCEEPDDDELQLSDVFKDPPHVRLACQLKIRPGAGTVRLKVLL